LAAFVLVRLAPARLRHLEELVDLLPKVLGLGPIAQPRQVPAIPPDDLAERPAGVDAGAEHRPPRSARRRTRGTGPGRLPGERLRDRTGRRRPARLCRAVVAGRAARRSAMRRIVRGALLWILE